MPHICEADVGISSEDRAYAGCIHLRLSVTTFRKASTTAFLGLALLSLPYNLGADDGAASIKAGGLIVMRKEPRITMAKEVLSISARSVDVSYEFRNDSDEDVVTEVAFPIPRYHFGYEERDPKKQGFDDFKLWIDGQRQQFATEERAFLGRREITAALKASHIEIGSFGRMDWDRRHSTAFEKLNPAEQKKLVTAGLFTMDKGDDFPQPRWEVEKKYHWKQHFPAHAVVKIRHQYTPVAGDGQFVPDVLIGKPTASLSKDEITYENAFWKSICLTDSERKRLSKASGIIFGSWVDFILTTANTWKQPIEDFTLIVERPTPGYLVSFCWNGDVEKIDSNHFRVHTTNLVPTDELRIGYYKADKSFVE